MPTNSITNISSISWNDFNDTTLTDAQQVAIQNNITTNQPNIEITGAILQDALDNAKSAMIFGQSDTDSPNYVGAILAKQNLVKPMTTETQVIDYIRTRASVNNGYLGFQFTDASGQRKAVLAGKDANGVFVYHVYSQPFPANVLQFPDAPSLPATQALATAYLNQASVPAATAVLVTTPDGQIRYLCKNWAGKVYLEPLGATEAELRKGGYTNFPDVRKNLPTITVDNLNSFYGTSYNYYTLLTSVQFQQVVSNLANGLAAQASKLDLAHGGGIKYYNGKWFANGQNISFMQVYLAVRVNTLWDIQNELTTLLNRVQERNKKLDMANDFLTRLAAATPTDSSSSIAYSDGKTDNNNDLYDKVVKPWQTKYGVTSDPFSLYCPEANITKTATVNGVTTTVDNGGPWKQAQLQGAATSVQSFIQTLQTNNTTDQSYIQNLTNRQGENTDAISNMIKSIATQLQSMASNFSTL